jgi:hypothetical protein
MILEHYCEQVREQTGTCNGEKIKTCPGGGLNLTSINRKHFDTTGTPIRESLYPIRQPSSDPVGENGLEEKTLSFEPPVAHDLPQMFEYNGLLFPRFREATHRTTRWIDRCIAAHSRPSEQNLFAIIQGGLDPELRDISLKVAPPTPKPTSNMREDLISSDSGKETFRAQSDLSDLLHGQD